jgi:hypothetical protein
MPRWVVLGEQTGCSPGNAVHVDPLAVMLGKTGGEEKPCAHGLGVIRAVVNEKQKAEEKGTEEKKGEGAAKPNDPMKRLRSNQGGGEVPLFPLEQHPHQMCSLFLSFFHSPLEIYEAMAYLYQLTPIGYYPYGLY